MIINDLQIGKAGEYLVCADLILNGFIAYPSEQGLPYDLVLDTGTKMLKVQVKTTRKYKEVPQRAKKSYAYIFNIGRHGKGNKKKGYNFGDVDMFALVALDSKIIAYLPNKDVRTTMNFRVPALRGTYYDEQGVKHQKICKELYTLGYTPKEIAKETGLKVASVYNYLTKDITPKGNNNPIYFNSLTLEKCLSKICLK